mmetsp:Transcript_30725/g.93912  ORF Transcript_30725/g.93912 Transcript_30725/m.93912 type:complete len:118 (+) Transcript_30725:160-513(+)
MRQAFERNVTNVAAKKGAALCDALNRHRRRESLTVAEQALLAVQRYVITVLPLAVARRVVDGAANVRAALKGFRVGDVRVPNLNRILAGVGAFPDKHRIDVALLLEECMNVPPGVDL